jgi:hypothetical protein
VHQVGDQVPRLLRRQPFQQSLPASRKAWSPDAGDLTALDQSDSVMVLSVSVRSVFAAIRPLRTRPSFRSTMDIRKSAVTTVLVHDVFQQIIEIIAASRSSPGQLFPLHRKACGTPRRRG